jgi:DNA-binding response OmpR family regulator
MVPSSDGQRFEMRVLIAGQDSATASFVRKGLEAEHYAVDVSLNQEQARALAAELDYDLVMLDLNSSAVNVGDLVRQLRSKKQSLPILILTRQNDTQDGARCLDLGADDFVGQPFSFTELSARIRALLRRSQRPVVSVLKVNDLELDRIQRKVHRGGKRIELTAKEFSLLEYLMLNAGRRVTRAMIIEHVWDLTFDTSTNVVDVYVNYLRRKIDDNFEMKLIHTVRGVGYELHGLSEN